MKLLENNHTIDIVNIDTFDDGLKFIAKKDGDRNIIEIVNSNTGEQILFLSYEELEPTIRALQSSLRFLKQFQ